MNDNRAVSESMRDWYVQYYTIAPNSPAHADFCREVYGRDLCQHGYMTMPQLDRLIETLALRENDTVLELGCGSGGAAAYISEVAGSSVVGLDYIPEAIRAAETQTFGRRDRLKFLVGDINEMEFPAASFDAVIAIDTLYFSDLDDTIGRVKALLRPGGRLGAYYIHILWNEDDDRDTLRPENTPLGQALRKHGLPFQSWDMSLEEYERSRRILELAPAFKPRFEAEGGSLFLYENRMVEAGGNVSFYEGGRMSRYLYCATR